MLTFSEQAPKKSTPDPETLKPRELRRQCSLFTSLGGVARVKVTPRSIPNLEVKLLIADNTAGYAGGNVGRRRLETFLILYTITTTKSITFNHITFTINLNIFSVIFYYSTILLPKFIVYILRILLLWY